MLDHAVSVLRRMLVHAYFKKVITGKIGIIMFFGFLEKLKNFINKKSKVQNAKGMPQAKSQKTQNKTQ